MAKWACDTIILKCWPLEVMFMFTIPNEEKKIIASQRNWYWSWCWDDSVVGKFPGELHWKSKISIVLTCSAWKHYWRKRCKEHRRCHQACCKRSETLLLRKENFTRWGRAENPRWTVWISMSILCRTQAGKRGALHEAYDGHQIWLDA